MIGDFIGFQSWFSGIESDFIADFIGSTGDLIGFNKILMGFSWLSWFLSQTCHIRIYGYLR